MCGDDARFEDVLRKDGGLGGVASSTPFKELKEVRLCRIGVVDRALLPRELELGVLFMGLLGTCICPNGEAARYGTPCEPDCKTVGELGSGAVAAVLSESRLTLSEMNVPLLFVDTGISIFLCCSGTATGPWLVSMADIKTALAAAAHSSTVSFFKPSSRTQQGVVTHLNFTRLVASLLS